MGSVNSVSSVKPVLLVILDGFGLSNTHEYNAVYHAHKPNIDAWMHTYPHTQLCASGECVGLLPGYIGNSEVGHMAIGCGRVMPQPIQIISRAIENKTFFENKVLLESFEKVVQGSGRLHIMGLLSDAGVHSHIEHFYAYLKAAKAYGIRQVFVHCFLDGRDVAPKMALYYVRMLCTFMYEHKIGTIASLHGRFYAMDRDTNWDRTKASYDVLVGISKKDAGISKKDAGIAACDNSCIEQNQKTCVDYVSYTGYTSYTCCDGLYACIESLVQESYTKHITDEFFIPVLLQSNGIIHNGDGIIFANFRPDRARQLTRSFVQSGFDQFKTKKIALSCFVTPVAYATDIHTAVLFKKKPITNTLKDILSEHHKSLFTIAETEKYAHVTYFFNGGREALYSNETRVLIKSIPSKNYVGNPQMSAKKITQAVIDSLQQNPADFYVINYANPDMVGHSGNFEATVAAIECIDAELGKLYDVAITRMDGTMYVTSDHGAAEKLFDPETGQPHTAHTTNPVPFIFIQKGLEQSAMKLPLKQLADIMPFVLQNMGIKYLK